MKTWILLVISGLHFRWMIAIQVAAFQATYVPGQPDASS
jgi:hypothetical protein